MDIYFWKVFISNSTNKHNHFNYIFFGPSFSNLYHFSFLFQLKISSLTKLFLRYHLARFYNLSSHSSYLHEHVQQPWFEDFFQNFMFTNILPYLPHKYTCTLWILHSKFENMIFNLHVEIYRKDFLTPKILPVNMALKERKA